MVLKINSNSIIGIASLGISGALLYFNWKNNNSREVVKMSGGGGGGVQTLGTSSVPQNAYLSSSPSSFDNPTQDRKKIAEINERVVQDARRLAEKWAKADEKKKLSFEFDSSTQQTSIKDDSGETIGIYDYKRNISTTPELQAGIKKISNISSSSNRLYTPVRREEEEKTGNLRGLLGL